MKGYWRNESTTKESINDWSRFNSDDLEKFDKPTLRQIHTYNKFYFQKDKKRVRIYIV